LCNKIKYNIIIIGNITSSGNFLAQVLMQDARVEKIYHVCADESLISNDKYITIGNSRDDLLSCLKLPNIDLIIVIGIFPALWVKFQEEIRLSGIPYIMPTLENSMLEWSKITSKKLLNKLDIPTPTYKVFTTDELLKSFNSIPRPFVLKYEQDIRGGEQTIIIDDNNYNEQYEILTKNGTTRLPHLKNLLGEFCGKFIVEEFIKSSSEISYHAVCNQDSWSYIGSARDYKKKYNNDIGNNTDGVGSYSITSNFPLIDSYVDKIVKYLKSINTPYIGILYLGIIINSDGVPMVLEINTRPGSPEIQSIIPVLDTNLLDLLFDITTNKKLKRIKFLNKQAVSVLVKGNVIFNSIPKNLIISKGDNGYLITAVADTITNASDIVYNFLKTCNLKNCEYRTDIGYLK